MSLNGSSRLFAQPLHTALELNGPALYVDSVDGLGTNDGASMVAPKRTIGSLTGLITDGTEIHLKRNSRWREQLTVPADNVSVTAYGTGAKPLLDCSDEIPGDSWSKTPTTANVYQAQVAPNLASQDTWVRVWEDNTRMVRARNLEDCDATAGSYYPSADTGTGPITLYVHATDGSNPVSSGHVYEYNARRAGITNWPHAGLTLTGIHTRRNLYEMGSLVLGDDCVITDCLCEDGSKHNLYYGEGSILTDVVARDAYYNGPLSYFVGYKAYSTGKNLTHVRCRAENTTGVIDEQATAFYFHSGGLPYKYGSVSFTDCYADGMNTGLDTGYFYGSLTIDGLECPECNFALAVWDDATVSRLAHTCPNGKRCISLFRAELAETPGVTLTLRDSRLAMAAGAVPSGGMIWSQWDDMAVNLERVLFAGQDNEYAVALTTGTGCRFTATHCEFSKVAGAYLVSHGTIASDYNMFRDWIEVNLNGTRYDGLAAWKETGQDSHSGDHFLHIPIVAG